MALLNIKKSRSLPKWNYTLRPSKKWEIIFATVLTKEFDERWDSGRRLAVPRRSSRPLTRT